MSDVRLAHQQPRAVVRLYRIFLSSPEDVSDERNLARRLIKEDLPYLPAFRGRVSFEVVAWDDPAVHIPMLAIETPQESVNRARPRPATCDITVVVLWSRMGTPLPEHVKKPNGEAYASGTEWEYVDACNSTFEPKPKVLVYRRTEDFKVSVKDPEKKKKEEQFERVEKFFKQFVKPDGSLLGVTCYNTPTAFRDLLRRDLEEIVCREIESPGGTGASTGTTPSPPTTSELVVDRIDDFEANKDCIRDALKLYEQRIPRDERCSLEQMVDLVRRHLSEEFGPTWKMHFHLARFAGQVIGMLVGYEDIARNFAFIAYLAARNPRCRGANPQDVSKRLGRALLAARLRLGLPKPRFLFEVDDPTFSGNPKERHRRISRIRLFDELAPFEGLHLRILDVRYLQPRLEWARGGPEKQLLLCYAAPGLGTNLPKNEVVDILTWTYRELYGEDIFEDASTRAQYGKYIRGLHSAAIETLPEEVHLLRYRDLIEHPNSTRRV